MPPTNLLTDTELERQLNAALDAEKRARMKIARLKRASIGAAHRIGTQRKCVLGGVLLALAARGSEADARLVTYIRSYLAQHPPHVSNRAALESTPFALDQEVTHERC